MINYSGGNPSTVASPAGNGGICDQGSCPAPGLPLIALVGKIGPAGIPFYVGNAKTLVAPADGELSWVSTTIISPIILACGPPRFTRLAETTRQVISRPK